MNQETVVGVAALNQYVSSLLSADRNLSQLAVQGEISGFKRHTSGHLYFTLKDDASSVRCVMFRSNALTLEFQPKDGMLVVLRGYASLYERDGSFQLYARSLEKCGEGELYKVFLALKSRLEQQGYFDQAHKKPIPYLPRCVGVVTSGTGAVLQDILNVIGRRFPNMEVAVCPVKVQGEGSAEEIAKGILRMNLSGRADVLIVGRGGGSMEDLWAFNEPAVAQAIYESRIPVISAVGHETDFTIADFVADLRAPTPSAAAELAVPEYDALVQALEAKRSRLYRALAQDARRRRDGVRLIRLSPAFQKAEKRIGEGRMALDSLCERCQASLKSRYGDLLNRTATLRGRLTAMDPALVLERGYAFLTDENGQTVSSMEKASAGQRLIAHLKDGRLQVKVLDKERVKHDGEETEL